jgi:hypothetical protein
MACVKDLIPKDKFDTSSFGQLMALSDDEIEPIIPDLLIWIQDMNWPVAPDMIKVLASHRAVTEKHLPDLLKPEQKDGEWKRNIIKYLLSEWSSYPDDEQIIAELKRIAGQPTDGEREELVDAAAKEYLKSFV